METVKVVRPLGCLEAYSASRHYMGIYKCVANTCRYSVPGKTLQGRSLPDVVEQALARVVFAQSSLQVAVAGEDTPNPYFVRVPSIDLSKNLEWQSVSSGVDGGPSAYDDALLRLIERQHNALWPEVDKYPPWKLVIFRDGAEGRDDEDIVFDAMFAYHHAIGDGKSSATFHTNLLRELNYSSAPVEIKDHIIKPPDPFVLIPCQEDLIDFTISTMFFVKTFWGEFGPSWLRRKKPFDPWTAKPMTPDHPDGHARLAVVPPEALTALLKACRAHGTTLTPLIHILVLVSLSRRLPPDVASAFRSGTPISLRRHVDKAKLPPPLDISRSITNLVSTQSHEFGTSTVSEVRAAAAAAAAGDASVDGDALVWKMAATLRTDMKRRLDQMPNNDALGLLKYVSDWTKRSRARFGKKRENSWEQSNIGSMSGSTPAATTADGKSSNDEPNRWTIERSIFTQSATVLSHAFCVSVSSIDNGPLCATITWQEDIVDEQLASGVAADLQKWLAGFGETGKLECFAK